MEKPQISAETALLKGDITGAIIGAFYRVHTVLGYGFLESVYGRALDIELTKRGLAVAREVSVPVFYEGQQIGVFRADRIVEGSVVLEIKSSAVLSEADRKQLLNYLKATTMEVGLLLHFGPKAEFVRMIASNLASSPR
jgi:GxxExxY protein